MRNIFVNREGTFKDRLARTIHIHRVQVHQANKYSPKFKELLDKLGGKGRLDEEVDVDVE